MKTISCRLAIFDLDGTILDTLADLHESTACALIQNNLSSCTREEVRTFVGNGIRNLITRAVCKATGTRCLETMSSTDDEAVLVCTPEDSTLKPLIDSVHQTFTAHYRQHCTDHTAPYSGICELLQSLRAQKIQTAVVSNKADYGVQALITRYFPGLFDYASGERDGIKRKPAPDSVLAVMQKLGASPAETVYIGDSEVDILTASHAHIPCISVTWGFKSTDFLREHGAATIVHTPQEIFSLLCKNASPC